MVHPLFMLKLHLNLQIVNVVYRIYIVLCIKFIAYTICVEKFM